MKLSDKLTQAFYQNMSQGKVGYALLWLLGVPLPVLLLFYFIRGH